MRMSFFKIKNSPLATKLLRIVLGLFFIVALSTTVIQLTLNYKDEKRRLAEQVMLIADIFVPLFSRAVWRYDVNHIEENATAVLKNHRITQVTVLDENSTKLHSSSNPAIDKQHQPQANLSDWEKKAINWFYKNEAPTDNYVFDLEHEGSRLGELHLVVSHQTVVFQSFYAMKLAIYSAMIKTIGLWIIFLFVLNLYVSTPLNRISSALKTLKDKNVKQIGADIGDHLIIDSYGFDNNDEMGKLAKSYNEMYEALLNRDKAIHEYQSSLEQKVEERTEQLSLSNEELTKALAIKNNFLSNISHELRTPLNGILGMLTLLSSSSLNESQKRKLETANQSTQALLTIINDLLDLVDSNSNQLHIHAQDTNIRTVLEETTTSLAPSCYQKGLNLEQNFIHLEPSWVNADGVKIRQIYENLLVNAIKFTETGNICITGHINKESADEFRLVISIKDTGIGVNEAQLENLCEPFTQEDTSTTRQYGGLGLGLTLTTRLLNLMGGELTGKQLKNSGSFFRFSLPVSYPKNFATQESRITLHNIHFLCVGQGSANLDVLAEQLQHWGAKVTLVNTDHTLKDQCKVAFSDQSSNSSYDLILIDLVQLDVDVLTFLNQLQQEKQRANSYWVKIDLLSQSDSLINPVAPTFHNSLEHPIPVSEVQRIVSDFAYFQNHQQQHAAPSDTARKVLLIEKNQVYSDVALAILDHMEVETDSISNLSDTLKNLEENQYSLIVMDQETNAEQSLEMVKLIRDGQTSKRNSRIPIIAATDSLSEEEWSLYQKSGITDFIKKPYTLEIMQRILNKWS